MSGLWGGVGVGPPSSFMTLLYPIEHHKVSLLDHNLTIGQNGVKYLVMNYEKGFLERAGEFTWQILAGIARAINWYNWNRQEPRGPRDI